MVYKVIQIRDNGDEFISFDTENKEEAINQAKGEWELLCDYDRKHNKIEVRAYADDDSSDYDTVEWRPWYAVLMDADDNDWGTGSHDRDEAMGMAIRMGAERIAVIEEGDDPICVEEIEVQ